MVRQYVNLQTNEVLDMEKVETLADNAMLKNRPSLFVEWDFEKNNQLGFDIWAVTKGSKHKVYWICKDCKSSYDASINNRVKGRGCSYCGGKKVNHTNSLASLRPNIASEWHPTKNGTLTPNDVTSNKGTKAWWICKENHEWEAIISSRVKGNGCPYCSNKKVSKAKSLATLNPKVANEWHPTKNGKLTPNDVTLGSSKKVWWRCEENHEWEAIISNRTKRNDSCPYCSGKRVTSETSLAYKNPELAEEWHQTKNGDLTPHDVLPNSNQKVWWRCSNNHEWQAVISSRSGMGCGCPYCSGKYATKETSLATLRPDLAKQWHPTKNGELTPNDVTVSSGKKVWWLGECNHEWGASIANRNKARGCPYCIGKRTDNTNSLASLRPDLAKEWHPTKNKKTPHEVTCGSNKKVWWMGKCGHEWEANINVRNKGTGCPYCAKYNAKILKGFNDMVTTNPKLSSMLANIEDGYKYTQWSTVKLDWKCQDCGNIVKNKSVCKVNKRGLSCPSCSDGISYPEKFMYNLLKALNINFTKELSSANFDWIGDRRYDFYIEQLSLIIECHGGNHYDGSLKSIGGKTLEEEQENDLLKRELALSNGIKHYIELDCRYSEMEYIKNSILNSELAELFDLSNVNWNEISLQSEKSLVIQVWDMWEKKGMGISEIAKEVGLKRLAIRKYIQRGSKLGICKYDEKEARCRGNKRKA